MSVYINAHSTGMTPRVFSREITGTYSPTLLDTEKLESNSFFKVVDLVSEGPIEGFVDYTGKLVSGTEILKGIYINDVPVMTTDAGANDGQFNYRNISVAYKNGTSGQSGLYTGQTDDFYWLEDFSYTSRTQSKNQQLFNAKKLESTTVNKFYIGNHAVLDQDVDWLGITVGINSCYSVNDDGAQTGNRGKLHIWGDFTGVIHRSLPDNYILPVPDDSLNDHNLFVDVSGVANSKYREDIFVKLKDLKGKRPRKVYIENLTTERDNFRQHFSASLDTVTEIVDSNLSYPNSAYIATLLSAENLGSIPTRTFDLKLKKVKVPSNYEDLGEGPDGPIREDRHVGVWNGTFKSNLEWTDNPAWILYDLITNDRYGLGEYIKEIKVDKFQLYKIAKVCDALVATSKSGTAQKFIKERRYTCNLYLQNKMDAFKAINEIASVFRGIAYFNSSEIFISQNSLKESIFNFTNDNVKDGIFSYAGAAKHARFTAVKIAYKDKDDSFLPKYEYVEDPEGVIRYGLIEKEVTAVGCTSRDQALRLGRWILFTSAKEEETVTFVTDSSAEYLQPGDVFTISDSLRNGIKTGGRIKKITNDKNSVDENFILLDQQLDTGNYNFTSISFLIPSRDYTSTSSDTNQFKEFVHRNGINIGTSDDGDRAALVSIPIDSSSSSNTTLNNYIENTTSGAKILTHELEDLILKETISGSFINGGAGHKTFNDYFLNSGVLRNIRNGVDRYTNTEKIEEGFIYILNGSGDGVNCSTLISKEYSLLRKGREGDGSYSVIGAEYDSGKFNRSDNLSTVYTEATFDAEPTLESRNATDEPKVIKPVNPADVIPQLPIFGFPEENTVDLIIRPSGFINSQGQARSKVFYYFHNTEENQKYYNPGAASDARYEIRVREVDSTYYGNLLSTQISTENILQSGQYIISGIQDCGSYNVLYDVPAGALIENKAEIGGRNRKQLSLSNYQDGEFKEDVKVVRSRIMQETGSVAFNGCEVFGTPYNSLVTGNALSGEFEVLNPDSFYELRWSEANNFGNSPEKIMFFRGAVDDIPPGPCSNFEVKRIFDNIHFNWDSPTDNDLSHLRVYTGFKEETPLPDKDSFLIKSNSNFAVQPLNQSDGRGLPLDLADGKFHIRAVDFAGNTGLAINSNQLTVSSIGNAPSLHLSGDIKVGTDGTQNSYLAIFYSGEFNFDEDFKEYQIEVRKDGSSFVEKYSFPRVDNDPPSSGRFDFLAQGGSLYNVRARHSDIQGNLSPKANETFTVPFDDIAPGQPTWVNSDKNGSNLFLSWNNPSDSDLDRILLYSGDSNSTGAAAIHQESRFNSETIPLRDFAGSTERNLYFWLRAVDTSNNTGDFSVGDGGAPDRGQQILVRPPGVLSRDIINFVSGVENDENGDGASSAFINYKIEDTTDFTQNVYKIDISKNSNFNPLVASDNAHIEYGDVNMTGSGNFPGLLCNQDYYVRFRVQSTDHSYSPYQNPVASVYPIRTPKDSTLPKNPNAFTITSGPKQNFLEWNWGNGISRDIDSILVYKTGIPTGRLNETSSQNKYCWEISDISGYFVANPEAYSYKLNPGTAFIDNNVETGIFSGFGVDSSDQKQEPKQAAYYHYLLKTVDRSNNTGIGFVSGVSSSPHSDIASLNYGTAGHTQGYVTGGGIDDSYIENVRAGKILTDRITSNTFILARPSGRIVSDNVYALGTSDPDNMFGLGTGLYIDHNKFRIGDPSIGGQGMFFTGDADGDGVTDTLEIRGEFNAGTITIGTNSTQQLKVSSDGQLSIGDQSLNVSGYFTGNLGYSGDALPVKFQLNLNEYESLPPSELEGLVTRIDEAADGGGFLEINYWVGDDSGGDPIYSQEVRGLTQGTFDFTATPNYTNAGIDPRFGEVFANSPVIGPPKSELDGTPLPDRAGVHTIDQAVKSRRDWWRIIDVKFLVTKDGRLFAQNASIAGTVTANSFEPRQTLILGDESNPGDSIIKSFIFNNAACGTSQPSGFEIRGDGRATFNNLTVTSGIISGVSLAIGKCDSSNHFRADSEGNISIGPSTIFDSPSNDFHVSKDGKLYAVDAVVSGTISGSAGRIGGLELTNNYIATVGRTSNTYSAGKNGLYLGKDGDFSIANDIGNIIEYNGSNDYITVTGLQSKSYNTTETSDGEGLGFYIRGNTSRETSYISNFLTDSASASGIAKKIDTQFCGEVKFPIATDTYFLISGSRVDYKITDLDYDADIPFTTNDASNQPVFTAQGGVGGGTVLSSNGTFTSMNLTEGGELIVTIPAACTATVMRFNVGLKRI